MKKSSENIEYKIDQFHELEHLIPEISHHDEVNANNYIPYYISNKFQGDLIFGIVEISNNYDMSSIGNIKIFCRDENHSNHCKKYKKLIKKLNHKYSEIFPKTEWFLNNNYIIVVENNPHAKKFSNDPLKIFAKWQSFNGEHNEPQKSSVPEMTNFGIKNYLDDYVNHLMEDLNIKEFPNICIIISPLSFKFHKAKKTIPLGYLYLLFSTCEPKGKEFYQQLTSEMCTLWEHFNRDNIVNDDLLKLLNNTEPSKILESFYPKIKNLDRHLSYKKKKRDYSFTRYLDRLFNNERILNRFENRLLSSYEKAINYLYDYKFDISNYKTEFKSEFFTGGVDKLGNFPTDFDDALIILIQREVIKIAITLFDLPYDVIHSLLTRGDDKGKATVGDLYQYYYMRLIPQKTKRDKNKSYSNLIIESLSEPEKDWLLNNTKKIIDSFKGDKKNKLEIQYEKLKNQFLITS